MKNKIALCEYHIKNVSKTLPTIFATVFYTGNRPYNQPTDFFQLFPKSQRELNQALFLAPFHLVDLNKIPDDDIRQHHRIAVMELAMKNVHHYNFRDTMSLCIGELRNAPDHVFELTLSYVLQVKHNDFDSIEQVRSEIMQIPNQQVSTRTLSIYDFTVQESEAKGRTEGKVKGLEKAALNLLKETGNIDLASRVCNISKKRLNTLQAEETNCS